MSDNSTTTTLQLDDERQILEISNSFVDCIVLFTVQTENNIPFEFAIVEKRKLDNDDFEYNKADDGYVSGTAKNINKPTYMVLRSDEPCSANVTIQKSSTPGTKRATKTVSANTSAKRASASNDPDVVKPKFYKNKWVLITVVIISLAGVVFYFKRRKSKSSGVGSLNKPPVSSLLSSEVVSNETSSQSFGF
jgi:hypothetical protein